MTKFVLLCGLRKEAKAKNVWWFLPEIIICADAFKRRKEIWMIDRYFVEKKIEFCSTSWSRWTASRRMNAKVNDLQSEKRAILHSSEGSRHLQWTNNDNCHVVRQSNTNMSFRFDADNFKMIEKLAVRQIVVEFRTKWQRRKDASTQIWNFKRKKKKNRRDQKQNSLLSSANAFVDWITHWNFA